MAIKFKVLFWKGAVKNKYIFIKEPSIESEDDEKTCLIPKAVDGEKGKAGLCIALTFTSLLYEKKPF